MSDAIQRLSLYLDQFEKLRDTGGVIHNVHTDPEQEAASLTAADLRELLAERDLLIIRCLEQGWSRGYDACAEGKQPHNPYRDRLRALEGEPTSG